MSIFEIFGCYTWTLYFRLLYMWTLYEVFVQYLSLPFALKIFDIVFFRFKSEDEVQGVLLTKKKTGLIWTKLYHSKHQPHFEDNMFNLDKVDFLYCVQGGLMESQRFILCCTMVCLILLIQGNNNKNNNNVSNKQ